MAKRLKKTHLSTFIVLILCLELYSLRTSKVPEIEKSSFFFAKGVFHVHLPKSLKNHPFDWMKDPASLAGLDFVVAIRDEETQNLEDGHLGITDFYLADEIKLPAGQIVRLKTVNPFEVIAHPSHVNHPWNRFDQYKEGLEVVNLDSQWVREMYNAPLSFLGSILSLPFNQFLASIKLLNPYAKDLSNWDAMSLLSPGHFGIAGHELEPDFGFSESSPLHASLLAKSFRVLQNAVILKKPLADSLEERKNQIYQSIREGRLAITFPVLYPFEGSDWNLECDSSVYRSGDSAVRGKTCRFFIQTPSSFPFNRHIKLFKDGELVKDLYTPLDKIEIPVTEAGMYRLEVWAKTRTLFRAFMNNDTPYVFYNPIYVR